MTLVGAKVHNRRLGSSTLAAATLPQPEPTPDHPQHRCLDQDYDDARVEPEVASHADQLFRRNVPAIQVTLEEL